VEPAFGIQDRAWTEQVLRLVQHRQRLRAAGAATRAYRLGRYERAVTAYSVCIGAAPEAAGCFYNRALAFAALGRTEQAREDFDQALRLDPTLPRGPHP
jgi:tetratricopeptide (TPR) repeat protein